MNSAHAEKRRRFQRYGTPKLMQIFLLHFRICRDFPRVLGKRSELPHDDIGYYYDHHTMRF